MGVVRHQNTYEIAVLLIELECVRGANALERHIVPSSDAVISGLNVDGGDVIRQKNYFVRVNFVLIFVLQFVWLDEAGLKQSRDEGSRAGEWVKDVDALTSESVAELGY